MHLLLILDREHGKFVEKVPIIWFRGAKILKDILVRPKEKGCCRS